MGEEQPTRRSFLSKMMAGTLIVGSATSVGVVAAYLLPPEESGSILTPQRVKAGKAADIAAGKAKSVVVDGEPVWVLNSSGSRFVALSALCTHKGCHVKWDDKRRVFSCPCHEGLFDERGNVIGGLPRRPLSRFRVGLVNGELQVSRGEVEEG
jgi:cytochrome b6-f complex iron-sulfur subunit